MAKPKKPEAQRRPWCPICKGKRYVPGPPVVRNEVRYEGNCNVPCECVKAAATSIDAQSRAAGESV